MNNKKGLGRGLESLFAMYDQDSSNEKITNERNIKSDEINEISLDLIYSNPNQPRKNFDIEALDELALSIKIHGVIQPIVLNKDENGKYMIVAGERRYRASKIAGLKKIPAVVRGYSERQIKEVSIIENLQREDLNPIESARAIRRLVDEYCLTQDAVAERIGKSRPMVANLLRLLNLYPEVIGYVEKGMLSYAHARSLVVVTDVKTQIRLAQSCIKNKWTTKELERAVKNAIKPVENKSSKNPDDQSVEIKDFVDSMQRVFSTKVSLIGNEKKGRIYIDYYSQDDLERISDMIMSMKK